MHGRPNGLAIFSSPNVDRQWFQAGTNIGTSATNADHWKTDAKARSVAPRSRWPAVPVCVKIQSRSYMSEAVSGFQMEPSETFNKLFWRVRPSGREAACFSCSVYKSVGFGHSKWTARAEGSSRIWTRRLIVGGISHQRVNRSAQTSPSTVMWKHVPCYRLNRTKYHKKLRRVVCVMSGTTDSGSNMKMRLS